MCTAAIYDKEKIIVGLTFEIYLMVVVLVVVVVVVVVVVAVVLDRAESFLKS